MSTPEASPAHFKFGCMRNVIPDVGDTFTMIDRDATLRRMGSYVHNEVAEYDMELSCMVCSEECIVRKRIEDNIVTSVRYPRIPQGPVFTDEDEKHCIEF